MLAVVELRYQRRRMTEEEEAQTASDAEEMQGEEMEERGWGREE